MIGFYNYSVILTYIGLACSVFGIFFSFEGSHTAAVLCLMASGVCDAFDGKIARTCKRSEDAQTFGIQIDSLCDLVCFGALPAVICYSLGVRTLPGKVILALFVLAAVIRLGYFNVSEQNRQRVTSAPRDYYQGLPVTSISMGLPLVYLSREALGERFPAVLGAFMLLVALLFVADVKVKKPKLRYLVMFAMAGAFYAIRALGLA